MDNGVVNNGTNVRQWSNNDSDAQSWLLIPYQPEQPIQNGRYILISAIDASCELDVSGDTGDIPDNTNVQIWEDSCPSRYNDKSVKRVSEQKVSQNSTHIRNKSGVLHVIIGLFRTVIF